MIWQLAAVQPLSYASLKMIAAPLPSTRMDDYQFRAIRGLLVVAVILLGFIAGLVLAFAWQYL
jgi:hypothetical protein